ncbi:3301_t:CDS:10 [Funneliformis geosporum]|uniref:DNA-directed RNA polymerase III subunit RPC3 n=1 Tax=Funneliformis geosporum TaxID=1117311 RepID=A0A9W4WU71_9GLOM|nr:3301_t:CDS:10 [Funneliformis geosporum]
MAQPLLLLCCYIIRDDFGPIIEEVAKVLLQKGRLPLVSISKFSKQNLSKTRECLFVLIQHNLVYWAETREGSRNSIHYSIEQSEILARLNFGIYVKYANEWARHRGADEITHYMLLTGKGTFTGFIEDRNISKRTNKYKELKETFNKMVEKRYLTTVKITDSKSAQDKASEAEQRELAKVTNFIPTKKQMAEVKAKLAAVADDDNVSTGSKRKINFENIENIERPTKQQKGDDSADENQFFRVNYDKFNAKSRNRQIVEFVKTRINQSASIITKVILDIADDEKPSDIESRAISAQRIIRSVPVEKTDLFNQQMQSARRGVTREILIKQYLDYLMENDDANILRKKDENTGGNYTIRYHEVCESLKKEIFEDVIMEKYGFKGMRIVRILCEKGKLDEKAIINLALMNPLEVRQKLTELTTGGFVQIQEVPRSADRAPSRTFYLWEVDYKKCYDALLNYYYRTLANIHQVRFDYESGSSRLLEKIEKEDALRQLNRSSNILLLNETERKKLQELEQILTQLDTSRPQVREYASKSKKRKKEKIMTATAIPLVDAVNVLKAHETTYPNRTLELHVKTKLEKGKAPIRGSISLPKSIAKKVSWMVFAKGTKAEEAKAAGAHVVGAEELIAEITEGTFNIGNIDKCLSTPELYPSVTKIARILGPKMLMPMAKRGTVTDDIAGTIQRMDDKHSFNSDKLGWVHTANTDNIQVVLREIDRIGKDQGIKSSKKGMITGFIEKIAINPNMGQSIHLLDFKDLLETPSITR